MPAGRAEGGRFAVATRAEPDVDLGEAVPTTIPELWEFASRQAHELGCGAETEERERIWSQIVRSVNPAWDVNLGEQRKIRDQMARTEADRRARQRWSDTPAVLESADEIDGLLELYRGSGADRPSTDEALELLLADLHTWSIAEARVANWYSSVSSVGDWMLAAQAAVDGDISAHRPASSEPAAAAFAGCAGHFRKVGTPSSERAAAVLTRYSQAGRPTAQHATALLCDVLRWKKVSRCQPLSALLSTAEDCALETDREMCDDAYGDSYKNPYRRPAR